MAIYPPHFQDASGGGQSYDHAVPVTSAQKDTPNGEVSSSRAEDGQSSAFLLYDARETFRAKCKSKYVPRQLFEGKKKESGVTNGNKLKATLLSHGQIELQRANEELGLQPRSFISLDQAVALSFQEDKALAERKEDERNKQSRLSVTELAGGSFQYQSNSKVPSGADDLVEQLQAAFYESFELEPFGSIGDAYRLDQDINPLDPRDILVPSGSNKEAKVVDRQTERAKQTEKNQKQGKSAQEATAAESKLFKRWRRRECAVCTDTFEKPQLIRPCKHYYCPTCLAGKISHGPHKTAATSKQ